MALAAASPVPSSVPAVDSKSLTFNKNEGDVWNSFKDSGCSPGAHNADDGQNLASMVKTALDQQKQKQQKVQDSSEQQQHEKHYPAASTTGHGLSRNASFDSVTSHDSCTADFSTGSPVTVLPPLPPYTSCSSGFAMVEIPSSTAAAGWNTISSCPSAKTSVSSAVESAEIFNTFNFQDHMLVSEDCEQLLGSPVVGSLPSVLEFPDPFSRFSDHVCNEFPPVSELECLLPPPVDIQQHVHCSQAVESPESVGNNKVHNSPSLQQQQQEDFSQEFFPQAGGTYPELSSRRSESSLLSPPSARRRLSWGEYQAVEPLGGVPSTVDPLRFSCFGSQLQGSAYDHNNPFQLPLPSVQPLQVDKTLLGLNLNAFRSSSSGQDSLLDSLVGDAVRGSSSSSLKRPYSTMMSMQQQQQPVPSTCSISSSAPPAPSFSTSSSTSNKYLNFGAHLPIPPVPKNLSDNCSISSPILPPILPNLTSRNCDTQQQQQQANVAAFNAMLYKTQGNSSSEMMQQLQRAQCGQGTTTTGSSSCDSGAAAAAAARPAAVPPAKLRRRHGTATDPQSIAARTRRERFSDRIRILQSLVPNGERLDTVSMLGHTLEYVRFLQHQVWTLYNGNDDIAATADSESREKWKEFMEASQTTSTVVA